MWKGNYGKEPFDLRLTLLRTVKNLHWIIIWALIGTVVLGGAYYVKNVIFRPAPTYLAESTYKIEFASETWAQYGTYINETTWNTWVHTDEFTDNVLKHMSEQGKAITTREVVNSVLSAKLASDLRMPSTQVVTEDPMLSEAIAAAVEETMIFEFAEGVSDDIASIRVVDPGVAEEVLWDVRPLRAFVLAAVVSVLFAFGIYLLREIMDDSIWLPSILYKRYGLKTPGTVNRPEFKANWEFLLQGKTQVSLCPVVEDMDLKAVAEALKETDPSRKIVPMPAPILAPEAAESLRQAEAVVLVVPAGEKVGKPLEYVLEFIELQKVEITCALLWDADEALIRAYYRLGSKDEKELS